MTQRRLITYGPPVIQPMQIKTGYPQTIRLLHIGVHNSANRNAGDTLLFPVVRKTFDKMLGPCDWELRQAWEHFTVEDSYRVNREFDGVVIGGGGLLLRDQVGSDITNSGWQWNSTVEAVNSLEIPVFVFAIGYNRFRGQEDFDPVFTDHIQALVKKSSFFSLRNTGSINALQSYLLTDQQYNLRRQYCPTNVLWQLYPEYRRLAESHDAKKSRFLAFNAAFDRANLRFGDKHDETLMNVARVLRMAQEREWTILVVAHKEMDRQIEPFLDHVGVTYDTIDLTDAASEEIITFYAQVDLALGMRGHAQMIPFGLRRPIMSIISHDKMRFLLSDLNRPNWGIEVESLNLLSHIEDFLKVIERDRNTLHKDIAKVQQEVWDETLTNFNKIIKAFNAAKG